MKRTDTRKINQRKHDEAHAAAVASQPARLKAALAALALGLAAASTPAQSQSGLSCAELYSIRNTIYDELGLCFTRPTAKAMFPNNWRTCRYDSSEDMPISSATKKRIARILAAEEMQGCMRR